MAEILSTNKNGLLLFLDNKELLDLHMALSLEVGELKKYEDEDQQIHTGIISYKRSLESVLYEIEKYINISNKI